MGASGPLPPRHLVAGHCGGACPPGGGGGAHVRPELEEGPAAEGTG